MIPMVILTCIWENPKVHSLGECFSWTLKTSWLKSRRDSTNLTRSCRRSASEISFLRSSNPISIHLSLKPCLGSYLFTNSFSSLFNISHILSCFRICICLFHHGRRFFRNISALCIVVLFISSMPSVAVFHYNEQVRRSHDVRNDDIAHAPTWSGTRTLPENNYQCSILFTEAVILSYLRCADLQVLSYETRHFTTQSTQLDSRN